jgi:acyl-CoA thioesterase-1
MNRLHMIRRTGTLSRLGSCLVLLILTLTRWSMPLHAESPSGPIRIVAFGDSLTAGYMLRPADAFPDQLQKALTAKGHDVTIANAGVSGDTSAAGLARLAWSVPEGTEAVILELGANDALRGVDPELTRTSLERIVGALKARNIEILLAGMSSPENWGADYSDAFNAIYRDMAKAHGLVFYPFFLEGVALKPDLNLADGLHPTAKGIAIIVERILPKAEELIARVAARRAPAVKP